MKPGAWIAVLAAATCGTAAIFSFGVPGVTSIPNWYYAVGWRGLDPHPLSLVLLPAAAALVVAALHVRRSWMAIAMLVAASLIGQTGTTLLRGEHLETAYTHLGDGHAQFIRAAHDHRGRMFETLRNYDREVHDHNLGDFAPSKPPGTLAFYGILDAIAAVPAVHASLTGLRVQAARTPSLAPTADSAAVGVIAFPLLTALIVIPVWLLGWGMTGSTSTARATAAIWATSPSVLIVGYHTDGALFPLLGTVGVALAAIAVRRERPFASFAAGVVLAIAGWTSYGMLATIPLAIAAIALNAWAKRSAHGPTEVSRLAARHVLALFFGLAVGWAVLFALGVLADPFTGYRRALFHHARWKLGMVGRLYGFTGSLEFWLWTGLPMLAALLFSGWQALRELRTTYLREALLVLGLIAFHLALMWRAGSNECVRLWLFQVPFVAAVIAPRLVRASPVRRPMLLTMALAGFNLVLVPIVRSGQQW
jgi:hypothetical protein